MAKDPAFLFYPGDFNEGTQDFTNEEVGAYLRLLLFQFSQGHLPIERIKRKLGQDFESLWPIISEKFMVDENGFYFNQRLENEVNKRKAFSESRRKNISKRYEKEVQSTSSTYVDTSVSHMENENRNENKDRIKEENKEEKPKPKKIEIPTESEFLQFYKSELSKEFPGLDFQVKAKYESWVESGWKDGHGKKIINWKSKLKNTISFLKNPNQVFVPVSTPQPIKFGK